MAHLFESLPTNLFQLLEGYLSSEEYRQLLLTFRSSHLQDVMLTTAQWNLGSTASDKFFSYSKYRDAMLQKVSHRSRQLGLTTKCNGEKSLNLMQKFASAHANQIQDLSFYRFDLIYRLETVGEITLPIFRNINHLVIKQIIYYLPVKFSGCGQISKIELGPNITIRDLSCLSHILHITLDYCDINTEEIGCLRNVADLTIKACTDIESREFISDVSGLGGNYRLVLSSLPITDVSHLGNVHNLTISKCHKLREIPRLANVHSFILVDSSITDVRELSMIKEITLDRCFGIADIAPLINARKLTIKHPSHRAKLLNITSFAYLQSLVLRDINIEDFACMASLTSLSHLELLSCDGVSDINMFGHLRTLIIYDNNRITSVTNLGRVRTLILEGCGALADLSGLGKGNHYVQIGKNNLIKDFSPLSNCKVVAIGSCGRFTSATNLSNVETFLLSGTPLKTFEGWPGLKWVGFFRCEELRVLSNLQGVKDIHVYDGYNLFDISGLGDNLHVRLSNCPGISNVSSLASAAYVCIQNCDGIEDYSSLETVGRLDWVGSDRLGSRKNLRKLSNVHFRDRPYSYEELFKDRYLFLKYSAIGSKF